MSWEDALTFAYLAGAALTYVGVCIWIVVDAARQASPILNMIFVAPVAAVLWPLLAAIACVVYGDRLIFRLRGVEWR